MTLAYPVVLGVSMLSVLLSWAYFRRHQVTRPPIGVLNLRDVAVLLTGIVAVPYLYLLLPLAVVATLLALTTLGIVYFTCQPVLRRPAAIVGAALVALATDIATALSGGTASTTFLAINNLLLVVIVVGVANLWAQSGMKARDAAVLAGALALYDFVATSQLTLMTDLIDRLRQIPLAPFVGWRAADGALAIGLGDLLLASVFPLVMRKAYGRAAGTAALCTSFAVIALILGLIELRVIDFTVPVMVALGPLMVAEYRLWSRSHGRERTTREYLQAEPLTAPART